MWRLPSAAVRAPLPPARGAFAAVEAALRVDVYNEQLAASAVEVEEPTAIENEDTKGLSDAEHSSRLAWHGRNRLDVPLPSYSRLLVDQELLSPLMWFQLVSCFISYYYAYALIVGAINIVAATAALRRSQAHYRRLADLARRTNTVRAERGGRTVSVEVRITTHGQTNHSFFFFLTLPDSRPVLVMSN